MPSTGFKQNIYNSNIECEDRIRRPVYPQSSKLVIGDGSNAGLMTVASQEYLCDQARDVRFFYPTVAEQVLKASWNRVATVSLLKGLPKLKCVQQLQ